MQNNEVSACILITCEGAFIQLYKEEREMKKLLTVTFLLHQTNTSESNGYNSMYIISIFTSIFNTLPQA